MTKKCNICEQVKPLKHFYKASKKGGYQYACKKCMNDRYKKVEIKEGFWSADQHRKDWLRWYGTNQVA